MGKPRRMQKRVIVVAKNCQFCHSKIAPDYKDVGTLEKYLTERGKLLAQTKTGVCAKHQRSLSTAVKRARIVALLPFVVRV